MSESKLFFGGVPVGPDVDLLERTFPDLKHEQVLTHDEIAAVIGCSRPSPRYWSVMKGWKDRLREDHNIEMSTVRSVGYQVMTNEQRVDAHIAKGTGGFKAIGTASTRLAIVPREDLPTHAKARADYAQIYFAKVNTESRNFRKTIIPDLAPVPKAVKMFEPTEAVPNVEQSSEQNGDDDAPVQNLVLNLRPARRGRPRD